MSRAANELRAQIASDHADLTVDQLGDRRADTANHYMLYAVKPLPEYADKTPAADRHRVEIQDLLGQVWLHYDRLFHERVEAGQ